MTADDDALADGPARSRVALLPNLVVRSPALADRLPGSTDTVLEGEA